MLIFGTRGKRKTIQLDQQHALSLVYRYFHLFWLVRLAYGGGYELASLGPEGRSYRGLSREEAEHIAGPQMPQRLFWDQWSLLCALTVFAVCVIIAAALNR